VVGLIFLSLLNNFRLIKNYLRPIQGIQYFWKNVSSNFTPTHPIDLSVFIYCQRLLLLKNR